MNLVVSPHHLTVSPHLKPCLISKGGGKSVSACRETVEAKPLLSVGEVLLSRFGLFLDRTDTSHHRRVLKEHTSSLSLPVSVHTNTQKAQSLSHTETRPCQLRTSLIPAVKLMVLSNPSCLVFHEVSSLLHVCFLSMLRVPVFFNQWDSSCCDWALFCYWLSGSWLSPHILTVVNIQQVSSFLFPALIEKTAGINN